MTWSMAGRFGDVACTFDFVEDPSAPTSELSFVVDGVVVQRFQVPIGNGMCVGLRFGGHEVPMENPMASAIRRAVAYARAGAAAPEEGRFAVEIIRLMAGVLLD